MTEEEQVGSELHLQAYELFMQAPAAISVYRGPQHIVVLANDFALQLSGRTREEVIGKPVSLSLPEIKAQGFISILDAVLNTGESYTAFESPITLNINQQPQLLYLNLLYKPYRNKAGNITGVLGFATDVTEQVLAKIKVREKEQQFQNVLHQAPEPILILKGEHLVLQAANDPLLNLWNIKEDSIGKPFLEILPEMKEQGFYDLLQDVYKNGVTHHGYEAPVYFLKNNTKTLHYFNFVYHPYKEADNTISGVLVMASDVTAQVNAKRRVAEAEHSYMTLVMQAPVGICILKGPEFIVEIANDAYLELAGKQRINFIDRKLWEVLPEAKDQGFDEILTQVFQTGQPFSGSDHPVHLLHNGKMETVFVDFVYEPILDYETPANNRIMVIAYDVTEKVIARQKIEEAEQDARLGIELADLGTYDLHIATNTIRTSERFNHIFGFQQATSRNNYVAAVHPEDVAIRNKAHLEAMNTGKLYYEARVVWKDQSIRWVKVRGNVLFDNNTPYRIKGVVQDITDQKRFTEELTRQVLERTLEFQEANSKLSKSNAELEQFAYVTSHDLQEPLRKIQIFSSMVSDHIIDNPIAGQYVQKIAHSAKRMSNLIRNLLEYSRISSGVTLFEKVDLNEILSAVLSDFELLIEEKKALVSIEHLEVIEAVPLQMNQLFYNLVGNALKFAHKNVAPVITVKGQRVSGGHPKFPDLDPEAQYLKIEVQDNGIGFNQQYAKNIFTIFQRLNANSVYGGYGIGLAISKKIIDNHKGFILAESEEYKGACFVIVLPLKQI